MFMAFSVHRVDLSAVLMQTKRWVGPPFINFIKYEAYANPSSVYYDWYTITKLIASMLNLFPPFNNNCPYWDFQIGYLCYSGVCPITYHLTKLNYKVS